ncbi:hypothetical protein [Shewanella marisflavi]|uniref:Uncharacterized protein n=1 Tax=Shewanella marisflavi TaxID=260364 RepID=A0AAC9TZ31_9GAMM|nr:hypothetical protein [Shewanella marisflavi]ASJ96119.1 hypothetical protein CFF01_05710 [Shewanella marisflavi]
MSSSLPCHLNVILPIYHATCIKVQSQEIGEIMSHYDEFEMASKETPTWEFDAQDKLRNKRSKQRRRHQSNQPKRYEHDDEFDQGIWR